MHCMLMDLLHGFEVLSTTEETLFNSRNFRLYQQKRQKTPTKLATFVLSAYFLQNLFDLNKKHLQNKSKISDFRPTAWEISDL